MSAVIERFYGEELQEARKEAQEQGEKKAENTFARLSAAMQEHGCPSNDIIRTMSDTDFRKKMMLKYGIS